MVDLVDYIEKSLEAEGIADAEVVSYSDPINFNEKITVRKRVNGDVYTVTQQISADYPDPQQHAGQIAARMAQALKDELTEFVKWQDKSVRLDLNDEYKAECNICGATHKLKNHEFRSMKMAETAVPNPIMTDYRSIPQASIRFVLLAKLRDECQKGCPNSPKDLSGCRRI